MRFQKSQSSDASAKVSYPASTGSLKKQMKDPPHKKRTHTKQLPGERPCETAET